jgi:hypothetical protein
VRGCTHLEILANDRATTTLGPAGSGKRRGVPMADYIGRAWDRMSLGGAGGPKHRRWKVS